MRYVEYVVELGLMDLLPTTTAKHAGRRSPAMSPLHSPRRSQVTSTRPYEVPLPKTKHHRSALSTLNRTRKALPTVSLTNTNANASCINTSLFSSPTAMDLTERNFIPFPTSTSPVPFPSNSAVSESDYTALLRCNSLDMDVTMKEAGRPTHVRPRASHLSLRRRRSPARIAQTASRSRVQSGNSSIGNEQRSEPARHSPRRNRVQKDTQFLATIHRSIIWMMMMGSDAMEVDGDEYSRFSELKVQDTLLVGRLTQHLSQSGWFKTPIEPISSWQAYLPYFHGSHNTQPPPSPAPLPPTTTDSKTPILAPILTMPQLVASLIITRNERSCRPASRPVNVPRICAASASSAATRPRSPLSSEL